jgi:Cdc6-like AAA superfamily ATPase
VQDIAKYRNMITLVYGPTGSGKTHDASLTLSALTQLEQHMPTLYLDCKRLQESSSRMSDILSELDSMFEEAAKAKYCTIVLDDLDRLAPNLLGGDDEDPAARVQHSANPTAEDQSKLISDRILQLVEAAAYLESKPSAMSEWKSKQQYRKLGAVTNRKTTGQQYYVFGPKCSHCSLRRWILVCLCSRQLKD